MDGEEAFSKSLFSLKAGVDHGEVEMVEIGMMAADVNWCSTEDRGKKETFSTGRVTRKND